MTFKILLKAIRVHQWAKNTLMFLPFLLTPSMQDEKNFLLSLAGLYVSPF